MKTYVLGFAFTPNGKVALIQKNRPEWQAGRFNGIGGHVEDTESHVLAMAREFYEETGVPISQELWEYRGLMRGEDWVVHVFTVTDPSVSFVQSMTDEIVELLDVDDLKIEDIVLTMANVKSLIHLCRVRADFPTDRFPMFELRYS